MHRVARALAVVGMASILSMGCGSDDEGGGTMSSCFVQCTSGLSVCTSYPGLSHASCEQTAESDCGGPAAEIELQQGCECPFDGAEGECTDPPPWS